MNANGNFVKMKGKEMGIDFLGKEIPKLGFGLMRLPMIGEEIDIEQTKKMVDRFMEQGFTYFDTAYVYTGGNQKLRPGKQSLSAIRGNPSSSRPKCLSGLSKSMKICSAFSTRSLERTGAGYFDYYLLHALNHERLDDIEKVGAWKFIRELKEKGLIKHLGFSFHDEAVFLDQILTSHPEAEFVQLQINYADWENGKIQSRQCYEVARKHNKPIIVMEPMKGGSLAAMSTEIQSIFTEANPEASLASWAMRYAASLDGIITVLSGMSNLDQMNDNLSYMSHFQPLTGLGTQGYRASHRRTGKGADDPMYILQVLHRQLPPENQHSRYI